MCVCVCVCDIHLVLTAMCERVWYVGSANGKLAAEARRGGERVDLQVPPNSSHRTTADRHRECSRNSLDEVTRLHIAQC